MRLLRVLLLLCVPLCASAEYLGEFSNGKVIPVMFGTYADGASITMTGIAVTDIEIYRGSSMTQRASDAGYALIDTDGIDLDGITGFHGFSVDTSDNTTAGFWSPGITYTIALNSVTIDSATVVGVWTFVLRPDVITAGTATAANGTSLTLQATTDFEDSKLVGMTLCIEGGTGAAECELITAWVNTTNVATVAEGWAGTDPASGTEYYVLAGKQLYAAVNQSTGRIEANVKELDDDATAAGNAELLFDNTGFVASASTIGTATAVTAVSAGGISESAFATTTGSFTPLGISRQGTAQSATATTVVLDAAAAFGDDTLIGAIIMVCGSTQGYCQSGLISDSVLSTDTVTVPTWMVTPSGTITYKLFGTAAAAGGGSNILTVEGSDATTYFEALDNPALALIGTPAGASVSADVLVLDNFVDDVETRIGFPTNFGSGSALADNFDDVEGQTDDIGVAGAGLTAVDDTVIARLPTALVSGRMDASVGAMVASVITSTVIATDAIGPSEIATDALGAAETAADFSTEVQTANTTLIEGVDATNQLDAHAAAGLDAAGVRAAVGLASANLDTQLTNVESGVDVDTIEGVDATNQLDAHAAAGLDAAGVRAAVGLASANLDTQIGAVPTVQEIMNHIVDGGLDVEEILCYVAAILVNESDFDDTGLDSAEFMNAAGTAPKVTVTYAGTSGQDRSVVTLAACGS